MLVDVDTLECFRVDDVETNFPPLFQRFFVAQTRELSRQCVEPPLQKKPSDPPFSPKPSILPVATFLIESVKKSPQEMCQQCKQQCLPPEPKVRLFIYIQICLNIIVAYYYYS